MDEKSLDFRLTKLNAFSGAMLPRMLYRIHEVPGCHPGQSEGSDADLRSLMTACPEHCGVLLPAVWNPVMVRGNEAIRSRSTTPLSDCG